MSRWHNPGKLIECNSCGVPRLVYNNPIPKRCKKCVARPLKELLFRKIHKTKSCWLWKGSKSDKGYASFQGKHAHRTIYQMYNGKIGKYQYVCHRCDNRQCVNPKHLFLGSQLDNMRDCKAKGRNAHGERHAKAKLKEDDILWIRKSYQSGYGNKIAKMFNVSWPTIFHIVKRNTWTHI